MTEPSNPLLAAGLPDFERIAPEHAVPAIETRLGEYQCLIDAVESRELPAAPETIAREVVVDDAPLGVQLTHAAADDASPSASSSESSSTDDCDFEDLDWESEGELDPGAAATGTGCQLARNNFYARIIS